MEQQKIQDRNKEIAKMLGGNYKRIEELSFEPKGRWNIKQFPDAKQDYDLKFHSDYNWLMEAVEFIRLKNWSYDTYCPSNTDGEFECNFWDKISPEIEGRSKNSLKEAVFIAVSDFAKLYNNKEL